MSKTVSLEGLGAAGKKIATGKKVPSKRIKLCKGVGKNKKCIRVAGSVVVSNIPAKDKARASKFFGPTRKKKAATKKTGRKTTARKTTKKARRSALTFGSGSGVYRMYLGLLKSKKAGVKTRAKKSVCTMLGKKKTEKVARAILKDSKLGVKVCKGHKAAPKKRKKK